MILKPSAIPDTNLPEAPLTANKKKLKEGRAARAAKRAQQNSFLDKASDAPDALDLDEANHQPLQAPCIKIDSAVQVDTTGWDKLKFRRTSAITFDNDDDLIAWTGLKSRAMLESIVKAITFLKQYRNRPQSSVTLEEEVLIVFIKLKTNVSFRCISVLFRLHSQTVSTCFQRILPFLTAALKPLIHWPSEEQVKKNIPHYFKPDFEDVIAVLDCTEISIMKPKCLHCRITTYSHYKSRETAKFLVAVTPAGSKFRIWR